MRGHGPNTILKYASDDPQGQLEFDAHTFLLGDDEWDEPHAGGAPVGSLILKDLTLDGANNANFAVLRLWRGRSTHRFDNVIVIQRGYDHGIDASDVFLSVFTQVIVRRDPDTTVYPNHLGYKGRGLWLHTEEAPFYVSGEMTLDRISAFGYAPASIPISGWSQGIVIGENVADRFIGGVTARFLNAEVCSEGVVIGKGVADIDCGVTWVERNLVCGVRIFNGARDVTFRRTYTMHTEPWVSGGTPGTQEALLFLADIVLGKKAGNATENSYEGIELDGVYQHFLYGPAVRLYRAASGGTVRDLVIRNVRSSEQFLYNPNEIVAGVHGPPYNAAGPNVIIPIADAVVMLDNADYEGLVVENIRPGAFNGGLPANTSGGFVKFINRPELVDRLVYSGPYNKVNSHGVFEVRRPAPALRGLTHLSNYQIRMNDPAYHRIDATSGPVVITLPNIVKQSANTPEDRIGVEYHLMKVAGASNVTIQGAVNQAIKGHLQGSATTVVLVAPYEYVRVRSISEGGSRFWEIVDRSQHLGF